MFKINRVVQNSLKLSAVLALSLTVFNSFGDYRKNLQIKNQYLRHSLSPYEGVRHIQLSVEHVIEATNNVVQAHSDIPEDIKTLVGQYTDNLKRCSMEMGYESSEVSARINAFLGVRAFKMAMSNDNQKKAEFFQLMADVNAVLSEHTCVPPGKDKHTNTMYGLIVHIQALGSALIQLRGIENYEELQREKREWAEFLNVDEEFSKLEVLPVRRHL